MVNAKRARAVASLMAKIIELPFDSIVKISRATAEMSSGSNIADVIMRSEMKGVTAALAMVAEIVEDAPATPSNIRFRDWLFSTMMAYRWDPIDAASGPDEDDDKRTGSPTILKQLAEMTDDDIKHVAERVKKRLQTIRAEAQGML